MRLGHPATQPDPHGARLLRTAWLASFAITLLVIAVLLLVKSAQAAAADSPLAPPAAPLAIASLADEEDEEEWEEEGEEAEEDEGEEEEWEGEGEEREECGLRTARASAVADRSKARVRTQISYTAYEPVQAAIDFRLSGPKGSVTVGRQRKRLSFTGVISDNEHLSKGELAKVVAARSITVTIRVLDTPDFCRRYFDRHLKSRRSGGDRISWLQHDSVFGD